MILILFNMVGTEKFFNKVRVGDYFLLRRPQKVSENKKFYFLEQVGLEKLLIIMMR